MDAKNAVEELLDNISEVINGLDAQQERIMVLCTVSEHCKAYAETILAHQYHGAIYRRRQASE